MTTSGHTLNKRPTGRPASATLRQAFPDVADQLVDQSLGDTLAKGSSSRVEWQCPNGHRWHAVVYNRTASKNPTGCPVCAGKLIQPGVNDLATLRPDVAALLKDQSLATTLPQFSNKKVELRCAMNPQHTWNAPVSRLTKQGSGCPVCSGRVPETGTSDLATRRPDIASMLVDTSSAAHLTEASSQKVKVRCTTNPRHIWTASVYHLVRLGTGCPVCSGRVPDPGITDLATTDPAIAATLVDVDQAHRVTRRSMKKLEWRCPIDPSHTWAASVSNRVIARASGCPVCDNKVVVSGVNDLATTHPNLAAELADPREALTVTAGSDTVLQWVCAKNAEHVYAAHLYHRTGKRPTGCPRCSNRGPSNAELELSEIVRTLAGTQSVLTSDQTILPGRHELDIVIPHQHLAIEFNGTYWHSEGAGRTADFHQNKSAMAAEAGYQLLHVWADDFEHRRGAIIRTIAHKMHAVDRLPLVLGDLDDVDTSRVMARTLRLEQVSSREARQFLTLHHVQGAVGATIHLGLRDGQGRLRALLSLRSPRANARMHRDSGQWEIQRYATAGIVAGGFTKLLSYAQKLLPQQGHALTGWISFSAREVSDGGLYRAAGFTAEAQLPPDYRYVGNATGWTRAPKERFQKKRFRDDPALDYEEGWTERQAAQANGLYRVWDAGKTRWVKPVS